MKRIRIIGAFAAVALALQVGCQGQQPKPYGEEHKLFLPGDKGQVWAVAPTVNLSGVSQVDPLLNSDVVFQELQLVDGVTAIPVNRVSQVFASLKIEKIESESQAYAVCDLLGCDGIVVPTITIYDPYNPPKVGASLQLFIKPGAYASGQAAQRVDPHELERSASPGNLEPMARPQRLVQAVGLFDAADGSTRRAADSYAVGRSDPNGPLGRDEVYQNMDRYCGFVYHELLAELLGELTPGRS